MKSNTKGESSQNMKSTNRLMVLKALCIEGQIKRSEIIKLTGLSKMTASNIADDLMKEKLITEEHTNSEPIGAGRRPSVLKLSDNSPCVGGIYVGRKGCSVLISDMSANVMVKRRKEYDAELSSDRLVDFICDMFWEIRKTVDRRILCVGISAPGPLDKNKGVIMSPANFFGIHDFPIKDILENRIGIPCILAKDTACAAQGELLFGSGKGMEDFLLVHLHNGIGGGIIVKGKVFDGAMGLGGEIGHITVDHNGKECSCGGKGCLECYTNEKTLTYDYNGISNTKEDSISLREIIKKAESGNEAARYAADRFCEYLSAALVSALNFIDTHHVILSYYGDTGYLERILEEKINRRLFASQYRRISVISSAFFGEAPVIGAAATAVEAVFEGNFAIADTW